MMKSKIQVELKVRPDLGRIYAFNLTDYGSTGHQVGIYLPDIIFCAPEKKAQP